MKEIWKDVKGYKGRYKVSNYGRVKSCHENKCIFLKNADNGKGYIRINLFKNSKSEYFSMQRLVALTFIPNPYNKPCVNHIDNNPSNNNVSNLEWVTPKENTQHAVSQNRMARLTGISNGRAKLNEEDVQYIRIAKKCFDFSCADLSDIMALRNKYVTRVNIYHIIKRRSWKHI
jgi:hypothetical protein